MGLITTGLLTILSFQGALQGEHERAQETSREAWVAELYAEHSKTRVVDLVLPGTHDSGSYAITASSPPAPGAPEAYSKVGDIASVWSKTQDQTLEAQLRGGVRYLDLRVAHFEDRLVLVHGLVSCDLDEALMGVRRFARDEPREPVLLDLQAMPGVSAHDELHKLLQEILGDHLFAKVASPKKWTLGHLWSAKRALICIVGHSEFAAREPEYRDRRLLDSVWTDSRKVEALRSRLDSRLRGRDRDRFQCAYLTFTPELETIILGGFMRGGGLRSLSQPLFELPGEWIPEWMEEGLRPNVVSVDFYEHTNVVDSVIQANQLLLAR
ncbi:MAG TPA: phosphatidylinositol-specific phospholipase C domain-containing protein [Planctomycetes bacterium]|nr:phosphatidylinositol-specific phospholipase C domain-containing protein [Planctomycetota bacterium]